MSIRHKLARLTSAGPGSRPSDAAKERGLSGGIRPSMEALEERGHRPAASGAEALAGLLARRTPPKGVPLAHAPLPGTRVITAHGPVHRIDRHLEPSHCHGRVPVASALAAAPELVAELALDRTLASLDLSKMLFIDTETTGLSVGAGTLPFLVGVAFFEDESLRVQQLLLTKLGEEAPMLRYLADRIAGASCVVSYNGKSFDWPLLRSRYVLNRVPAPRLPPHLDLLHCSRRVFKRRMGSVRLVEMERELLSFTREHDVAGAEIPRIFLTFVRSGDPGRLNAVVEHNGHDLVALAAILGELTRRFAVVRPRDEPLDHLGYARVAERAGDYPRAVEFASAAIEGGGDTQCTFEAWMLRARVARKAGHVAAEEEALLEALAVNERSETHLALAKLYEHRLRRLAPALRHAHACGEPHRLGRLAARLARQNRRRSPRRPPG